MSKLAFTETSYYDSIISNYFNKILNTDFPERKILHGNLVEKLRYGRNPHQVGAIYSNVENLKIKKFTVNNLVIITIMIFLLHYIFLNHSQKILVLSL